MSYTLELHRKAIKSIERQPDKLFKRINRILEKLKSDPHPKGSLKLKARTGDVYRIRIGGYRLIYEIDDSLRQIHVLDFDKRSDVYKEN